MVQSLMAFLQVIKNLIIFIVLSLFLGILLNTGIDFWLLYYYWQSEYYASLDAETFKQLTEPVHYSLLVCAWFLLSLGLWRRIFVISVQPREIACPRQGKKKEANFEEKGVVEADEEGDEFHEAKETRQVEENINVLTGRNRLERPSRTLQSSRTSNDKAGKIREADKTQQVDENRNVVTNRRIAKKSLRMPHSSAGPSHKAGKGKGKGKEVEETQHVERKFNVVTEQRKAKTPLRTPQSPGAPSHIAGKIRESQKTQQAEEGRNMVKTPPRTPPLPRTSNDIVEEDFAGQSTPEASPIGTIFNDFRLYQPWVDLPTPEKQPLESPNQMSPTLRDNNDLLEGEASAPWRPPSPGKRRFRAPQSPYQALPKSGDRDNDCYTPTKGRFSTRKTPPSWMKSPFSATPSVFDLDSPFSSISVPTTTSGKIEESAQTSANSSNEMVRYEPAEESIQSSAIPTNEQTSNEQDKPTEESTQAPSNHSNEIMISEPTEESAQSSTRPDNEISLFEPAERTPPSANPGKRHKPASFPKCRRSEEAQDEHSNNWGDKTTFITPKRPQGRPNASSRCSEAPLDAPSSSSNTGSPPKTTAVSPASSKIPIRTRPKLCGLSSSSNATTKPNLESQDLRARFARLRRRTVPEAREGLRLKDGGGS